MADDQAPSPPDANQTQQKRQLKILSPSPANYAAIATFLRDISASGLRENQQYDLPPLVDFPRQLRATYKKTYFPEDDPGETFYPADVGSFIISASSLKVQEELQSLDYADQFHRILNNREFSITPKIDAQVLELLRNKKAFNKACQDFASGIDRIIQQEDETESDTEDETLEDLLQEEPEEDESSSSRRRRGGARAGTGTSVVAQPAGKTPSQQPPQQTPPSDSQFNSRAANQLIDSFTVRAIDSALAALTQTDDFAGISYQELPAEFQREIFSSLRGKVAENFTTGLTLEEKQKFLTGDGVSARLKILTEADKFLKSSPDTARLRQLCAEYHKSQLVKQAYIEKEKEKIRQEIAQEETGQKSDNQIEQEAQQKFQEEITQKSQQEIEAFIDSDSSLEASFSAIDQRVQNPEQALAKISQILQEKAQEEFPQEIQQALSKAGFQDSFSPEEIGGYLAQQFPSASQTSLAEFDHLFLTELSEIYGKDQSQLNDAELQTADVLKNSIAALMVAKPQNHQIIDFLSNDKLEFFLGHQIPTEIINDPEKIKALKDLLKQYWEVYENDRLAAILEIYPELKNAFIDTNKLLQAAFQEGVNGEIPIADLLLAEAQAVKQSTEKAGTSADEVFAQMAQPRQVLITPPSQQAPADKQEGEEVSGGQPRSRLDFLVEEVQTQEEQQGQNQDSRQKAEEWMKRYLDALRERQQKEGSTVLDYHVSYGDISGQQASLSDQSRIVQSSVYTIFTQQLHHEQTYQTLQYLEQQEQEYQALILAGAAISVAAHQQYQAVASLQAYTQLYYEAQIQQAQDLGVPLVFAYDKIRREQEQLTYLSYLQQGEQATVQQGMTQVKAMQQQMMNQAAQKLIQTGLTAATGNPLIGAFAARLAKHINLSKLLAAAQDRKRLKRALLIGGAIAAGLLAAAIAKAKAIFGFILKASSGLSGLIAGAGVGFTFFGPIGAVLGGIVGALGGIGLAQAVTNWVFSGGPFKLIGGVANAAGNFFSSVARGGRRLGNLIEWGGRKIFGSGGGSSTSSGYGLNHNFREPQAASSRLISPKSKLAKAAVTAATSTAAQTAAVTIGTLGFATLINLSVKQSAFLANFPYTGVPGGEQYSAFEKESKYAKIEKTVKITQGCSSPTDQKTTCAEPNFDIIDSYTINITPKENYTINLTEIRDELDVFHNKEKYDVVPSIDTRVKGFDDFEISEEERRIEPGNVLHITYEEKFNASYNHAIIRNNVEITFIYEVETEESSEGEPASSSESKTGQDTALTYASIRLGEYPQGLSCWPASGKITQGPYNTLGIGSHANSDAYDIAPLDGIAGVHPVYSTFEGEVCAGHLRGGSYSDLWDGSGYGEHVSVETQIDGEKYVFIYGHLAEGTAVITEGCQPVHSGQIIGMMGSTGYSTGTHLHFERMNAFDNSLDLTELMPEGSTIATFPNGTIVEAMCGQISKN